MLNRLVYKYQLHLGGLDKERYRSRLIIIQTNVSQKRNRVKIDKPRRSISLAHVVYRLD